MASRSESVLSRGAQQSHMEYSREPVEPVAKASVWTIAMFEFYIASHVSPPPPPLRPMHPFIKPTHTYKLILVTSHSCCSLSLSLSLSLLCLAVGYASKSLTQRVSLGVLLNIVTVVTT